MSNRRALINITGHSYGVFRVTGRSAMLNQIDRHALWDLMCPAGHRTTYSSATIRKWQRRGSVPPCAWCGGKRTDIDGGEPVRSKTCSRCGISGHQRNACPNQEKSAAESSRIVCMTCCDLAHRRHWNGCRKCGGKYEPERPMTLDDFFKLPVENRRPTL